jgi:hypothetical protein
MLGEREAEGWEVHGNVGNSHPPTHLHLHLPRFPHWEVEVEVAGWVGVGGGKYEGIGGLLRVRLSLPIRLPRRQEAGQRQEAGRRRQGAGEAAAARRT